MGDSQEEKSRHGDQKGDGGQLQLGLQPAAQCDFQPSEGGGKGAELLGCILRSPEFSQGRQLGADHKAGDDGGAQPKEAVRHMAQDPRGQVQQKCRGPVQQSGAIGEKGGDIPGQGAPEGWGRTGGQIQKPARQRIHPGPDGAARKAILSDPVAWWKKWKELLGNRNIDARIYDTLGELYVLYKLLKSGENASWNGPDGATYDIETDTCFFEIKSTISRRKKEISISNKFQLFPPEKPLNVILCVFESTVQTGVSINSLIEKFNEIGYNTQILNQKLADRGFEEGMSSRNKMFILHEMLRYPVGLDFPRITPESFVDGIWPLGITDITYTVDLSDRPYDPIVQGADHDI